MCLFFLVQIQIIIYMFRIFSFNISQCVRLLFVCFSIMYCVVSYSAFQKLHVYKRRKRRNRKCCGVSALKLHWKPLWSIKEVVNKEFLSSNRSVCSISKLFNSIGLLAKKYIIHTITNTSGDYEILGNPTPPMCKRISQAGFFS